MNQEPGFAWTQHHLQTSRLSCKRCLRLTSTEAAWPSALVIADFGSTYSNPVLWRHVKCGANPFGNRQSDRLRMPSFLQSAAAGALKTNGHHIGSLSLYLFQEEFMKLLKHCPTTHETLGSGLLNKPLCFAPKLHEFYFPGNDNQEFGGWLRAQDIVRSEWACTSLEVSACQIVGIHRTGFTTKSAL
ncbi:MAG: hypothetical protein J3R72DRAFT_484585 [Linnemannia gamsii]|nr:MAG: hypothetical protein J3R72DRAFT_484585 [Linnemannia gamsii]